MLREYSALSLAPIQPGARLAEPREPDRVTLDDPAFSVMTDLSTVPAATITPERSVEEANTLMVERRVRLLFVLDAARAIAGVITATDLLGEKPMRFMRERGVPRNEVLVEDIMTPVSLLEAIAIQDVAQMRVGHVLSTLKAVRRQHLMAAEDGGRRVRGLFSASQVARQLGIVLQTAEVAQTFAEIEAALSH